MVLESDGQRATVAGKNFYSRPKIEREVETPRGWYGHVFVEVQHARMNIDERLHHVMSQHVELQSQRSYTVRIKRVRRLREHSVDHTVVILLGRLMQHCDRHDFTHPAQRSVFSVQNHDRILSIQCEKFPVV